MTLDETVDKFCTLNTKFDKNMTCSVESLCYEQIYF